MTRYVAGGSNAHLPHHEIAQPFHIACPYQDVQGGRARFLRGQAVEQEVRGDLPDETKRTTVVSTLQSDWTTDMSIGPTRSESPLSGRPRRSTG